MKRFHTHVSTSKAALQQRPEILHAVSVYAAMYVAHGMIYDSMLKFAVQTPVAARFIGEQCAPEVNVLSHDGLQGFLLSIWDDLGANTATTFQDSHDDGFVSETLTHASDAPFVNVLVHVAGFSADESFVGFDFAAVTAELASKVLILHRKPDAVKHEPCRLLGDLHITGDLVATDSVLAISDEPSCGEPLIQTDGGVLHDGSNLDGELALEMMTGALPHAASGVEFHALRTASGAGNDTVGPAPDYQIINAIVGIRKVLDGFLEALWFAHKSLIRCLNSSPKQWMSQVNYYPVPYPRWTSLKRPRNSLSGCWTTRLSPDEGATACRRTASRWSGSISVERGTVICGETIFANDFLWLFRR